MAQINKEPLYQQAYVILREQILSGHRGLGSRVDIQTVADELGISRTPVREAIRQLVQQGLLEADGDGRVRVFSPSVKELAEIYVVRAAIESASAAAVTYVLGELDVSPIESALDLGRGAVERGDWEDAVTAASGWHDAIVSLSGNTVGARILDDLHLHVMRHRGISMKVEERRRVVQEEHEHIFELMKEGDPEAVRQAVSDHILHSGHWAVTRLGAELGTVGEHTPTEEYLRAVFEEVSTRLSTPALD